MQLGDEKSLLEMRNDPGTYQWFLSPEIVTQSDHHKWVMDRYNHHRALTLVLELGNTVIGTGYLSDVGDGRAEISIRISTKYRGRGFARKLLDALIQRAGECGFGYLLAQVHEKNDSSINLFTRANFKFAEDRVPAHSINVEKPFKLMIRKIES